MEKGSSVLPLLSREQVQHLLSSCCRDELCIFVRVRVSGSSERMIRRELMMRSHFTVISPLLLTRDAGDTDAERERETG